MGLRTELYLEQGPRLTSSSGGQGPGALAPEADTVIPTLIPPRRG